MEQTYGIYSNCERQVLLGKLIAVVESRTYFWTLGLDIYGLTVSLQYSGGRASSHMFIISFHD